MNRRGFLLALAALVDPERLLWRPGKLISIPAPQVLKPGDTITFASRNILMNPSEWPPAYAPAFLKLGDVFTIDIETGPSYETTRQAYVVRAIVESASLCVPIRGHGKSRRRRPVS